MVGCVKISTVSQARGEVALVSSSQGVKGLRQFTFLDSENATASEGPTDDNGSKGDRKKPDRHQPYVNPDPEYTVGFKGKHWTSGDWVDYIIPGPVLTVLATCFAFYMYGAVWAVGTFVIMFAVDVLAYYANL
mmetsp:Transcript_3441/g.5493  ORF Transcript_3441/g.5493 Transcript_3441/m.5493 type:complete len:133 (+) Transcript_3441:82-480(+)